jgi:hypothetical protein
MTAEEKAEARKDAERRWNILPDRYNYTAWTYNENTLWFDPPTPRPETGTYFWQGTTSSWVERPQRPDDGKVYKLDYASATWVEVPQS